MSLLDAHKALAGKTAVLIGCAGGVGHDAAHPFLDVHLTAAEQRRRRL